VHTQTDVNRRLEDDIEVLQKENVVCKAREEELLSVNLELQRRLVELRG
jgi:hypothetical protein